MLTFTSWGMKEGLGRVKGGSSSDFSTFRPSGADHLRFLPPDGLPEPTPAPLATWPLESDPLSPNTRSPFSTLFPPPLPPLPRWLMPFSRSLCLEPPLQLWGASETALGGLRCPWLEAGTEAWAASSRGWVFFRDPFLKFLRVSEIHTSPTESLVQGSSRSWVVRSGQHEDQPWPKTKKGYSTKTSTLTWRRRREEGGEKGRQHNDTVAQNLLKKFMMSACVSQYSYTILVPITRLRCNLRTKMFTRQGWFNGGRCSYCLHKTSGSMKAGADSK